MCTNQGPTPKGLRENRQRIVILNTVSCLPVVASRFLLNLNIGIASS